MYKTLSIYGRPNLLKVCLYGFINGMGFMLSGNTLNFWLANYGIDNKIIGLFACVSLPYACKYFIAFFIDKYQLPMLGKKIGAHRSWLIFSQIMLMIILIAMSILTPESDLKLIAILGFFIALFSVIQYVILNGNRINILEIAEQGPGSAIYNIGYRLGMFLTGAGVIYISSQISWSDIYRYLAIFYGVLTIIVGYCYCEVTNLRHHESQEYSKNLLHDMITIPLKHFAGYSNFSWIVFLTILYQISDSMLMTMLNPFLLHQNYNAEEIASASKTVGVIMVVVGGFISGPMIGKIGIKKSLLSFSMMHMGGHALFIILSIIGKNMLVLYCVTGYVAFTGGMMTTAYISFISGASSGRNATVLYALLSSIVGLSWMLFPAVSGILADYYGWLGFFSIITIISCCTTIFTWFMPAKIYQFYKGE